MEPQLSRRRALRMMEASYLAAAAALIWLALYTYPSVEPCSVSPCHSRSPCYSSDEGGGPESKALWWRFCCWWC